MSEPNPNGDRSPTDVPFLVIFVLCFIAWASIGIYGFNVGDPKTLISPKDSMGSKCGVDSHVIDKPFLFHFDFLDCDEQAIPFIGCKTPRICVTHCPTTTFFSHKEDDVENKEAFCRYGTKKWNVKNCAKWYVPSYPYKQMCIPDAIDAMLLDDICKVRNTSITLGSFQNALERVKFMEKFRWYGQHSIDNVINSWWHVLLSALSAIIVSTIYIILLSIITYTVVIVSVISVLVFLSFSIYLSSLKYEIFNELEKADEGTLFSNIDTNIWHVVIAILCIMLAVIVITLIVINVNIDKSIKLIRECGKIIKTYPKLYVLQFGIWILKLLVVVHFLSTYIFLESSGKAVYQFEDVTESCKNFVNNQNVTMKIEERYQCYPEQFKKLLMKDIEASCSSSSCNFVYVKNPKSHFYLIIFSLPMSLWLISFLTGLEKAILGRIFTKWYWSDDSNRDWTIIEPSHTIMKYNLGTIALGSLLLFIYRTFVIKVITEYISKLLGSSRSNSHYYFYKGCQLCVVFSESVMIFISHYGYIMCAIEGDCFFRSARNASRIITRNSSKYCPPNVDFVLFLAQLLLTITVGLIAYKLYTLNFNLLTDTRSNHIFVPVALIAISTFITSTSFLAVHKAAAESLYLCFLVEYESRARSVDDIEHVPEIFPKLFKS